MKKPLLLLTIVALVIVAYSCKKETPDSSAGKTVYLDLPGTTAKYFTSGTITPSDNDIATLGRVLFYDGHLSVNNATACASCHKQSLAFADNVAFSRGFESRLTGRNSMPIENMGTPSTSFSNSILFWDGREQKLQNLVNRPISNHVEMGMDFSLLPEKLGELPYYPELFQKAYGSTEITSDKISKAVTYFMQSITVNASRFDDYQSQKTQLTAQELQGFNLFNTTYGCNRCHTITSSQYNASAVFADIGLDEKYNDLGRGVISGSEADNGKFRTPNLRNVALTAPYMHDGRYQTLDQVLEHYSHGIANSPNLDINLRDANTNQARQMNISAQDKQAIIAFLNTLTDYNMITDPKFSNPFKLK